MTSTPTDECFAGQSQLVSLDDAKKAVLTAQEFATEALREAFNKICKDAKVHQGIGPAMVYFETVPVANGSGKRFLYVAYCMTGEKPPGNPMVTCKDFTEVLRVSAETFRKSLKPNCTLVWRDKPSADFNDDGRWGTYWRFIQLDDDAREISIKWWF